MADSVSTYAAVQARIRALYSTLLTHQQLSDLSVSPDFNTLIGQLKNTPYSPYLERIGTNKELNPRRAAFQIRERLAETFQSIIQSFLFDRRNILLQFYRSFEVDNLKAVLRGIEAKASWERVRFVLFPYGPSTVLPAQAMLESGDVNVAIEMLRGTPYYETLSFAMKRYSVSQNLFYLEVALDLDYWRALWSSLQSLSGDDSLQAKKIIGSLVDTTNLMWAIRYKIYHHLSEEEMINFTLPFGFKVRDEDIRGIAAGADIARIVENIYPEIPGIDELLRNPQSGIPDLELLLQKYEMQQCQNVFAGNPFQIGIPLSYLEMCKLEIQDLIVLFEAKATHISAEEAQHYLVV